MLAQKYCLRKTPQSNSSQSRAKAIITQGISFSYRQKICLSYFCAIFFGLYWYQNTWRPGHQIWY